MSSVPNGNGQNGHTLVSGAVLARILQLSRQTVSLLPGKGAPHIETLSGPRYEVPQILDWCARRGIGNLDGVPAMNGSAPVNADLDCEAIERLTAAHHRALREHLIGLQSEPALRRFTDVLAALGFDDRQRYLAVRSLQLHVGVSAPGDGAIMQV